jgi:CxxC motif-containing protein (DUF1111 family)
VTAAQHPPGEPPADAPEVAPELLDALVAFQETLAVPVVTPVATGEAGAALFTSTGCAACHRPELVTPAGPIAPYTDLQLHDLGAGLADATVAGVKVVSRWRTAPLWGLGYKGHGRPTEELLHDGRARSVEEAILWHDGEARSARQSFEKLPAAQRHALTQWVESL